MTGAFLLYQRHDNVLNAAHMADPTNIIWRAASLIFIGLYLGARGGGANSLDALIEGRARRR